jgi:hypothetical protein
VRAAFGTAGRSRALGLTAISLGFLMITLDATLVNVALGPIGSDLGDRAGARRDLTSPSTR